jgi:Putative peptidoglycan binding domain
MCHPMIGIAERPCRPLPAARRAVCCMSLLLAMVAMGCPVAFGVDHPRFRKTLRGLSGVWVLVERLHPEAEQADITRRQVQTEVEQRLREGGIRVLSQPEMLSAFGRPALAVNIQIMPAENGPRELYVVHITVALKQQVLLERNMAMPAVEAATWEAAALGVVGRDAWPRVREDIATLVDRFIHEYRSVNPEPAARPESRQPSRPPSRRAPIRQAQERLAEQGFDPGPINGQMGAKTQAALRQFQRAQGLALTGELDERTRKALGME